MTNQKLLPALEAVKDKPLRYRPGNPRQYRFDARDGQGFFNVNGEIPITKSGEVLKMVVIGLRVFNADLFDKGAKNWAELFFLNEENHACCLLLHGYSVDNLGKIESELYYNDVNLNEVILHIKPRKVDGTNNSFYLCDFSFETADPETIQEIQDVANGLDVYRDDTLKEGQVMLMALNYNPPVALPTGTE